LKALILGFPPYASQVKDIAFLCVKAIRPPPGQLGPEGIRSIS